MQPESGHGRVTGRRRGPRDLGKAGATAAARWHRQWPAMRVELARYASLARMDRPIGTLLLLWPTLWALWIASGGAPSLHLLLVFVLGVFMTRSAGCVINDYADRDFDPHVERTRNRPLATGEVAPGDALVFAGSLLAAAFVLVLTTNGLTILLSFVAVPIAAVYPYMKRYTYVPQFFLGIAFSWSVPMAFAAAAGEVTQIAWLIFIANLLWVVVYDTIYAMVDREDDLRIGVKSTAILFDDADRTMIGIIQALMVMVLAIIGERLEFGGWYYTGVATAVLLMAFHQYLIRDRARDKCFQAFLHNNWIGMAVFLGIACQYAFGA